MADSDDRLSREREATADETACESPASAEGSDEGDGEAWARGTEAETGTGGAEECIEFGVAGRGPAEAEDTVLCGVDLLRTA